MSIASECFAWRDTRGNDIMKEKGRSVRRRRAQCSKEWIDGQRERRSEMLLVAAAMALGAGFALLCAMTVVGVTGVMRSATGHAWNLHMLWLSIGAGTLCPAATLLALLSMHCRRGDETSTIASHGQMARRAVRSVAVRDTGGGVEV